MCLLLRLLSLLVGFCASWGAPGSILEGSGTLRGGFWRLRGSILAGFGMLLHAPALAWRGCSDPYKTLAGVVRNAHRSILAIRRATQKTSKNRADSLLNEDFGQERAKIRSWSAPKPILEGFGCLPSGSWALLRRPWALLGASWALLGCLLRALGCLLAAKCCPRGTRARFWRVPGVSGEAFGGPQTYFFEVSPYISL